MQDVPSIIEAVVKLAVAKNLSHARQLLAGLNREAIFNERKQLLSKTWSPGHIRSSRASIKVKRKDPSPSTTLKIFRRDNFICRYAHCQRRTIYIPVLVELSRLFPDELPYHRHWKFDACHVLYWVYGTSIEHILSFPHGGDSAQANLITACYCCHDAKNYLHLEDLAWEITDPSFESNWDGLEVLLPALKQAGIDDAHTPIGKSANQASTQRHRSVPITHELIKSGCLIRACLPGKKSARNYRVERLEPDPSSNCADQLITLREMWRRSHDGAWVASRHTMNFKLSSLSSVSHVASIAYDSE